MEQTYLKLQKNNAVRSNQLSFQTAANTPINTPNIIAIKMELIAKTKVLGNVSLIIVQICPVFLKEVRKYGNFKAI